MSSVRNVVQMGGNQTDGFSAAAVEEVMSLDHISLGPDFVAVAGVFSDHAFLDYLYQQPTVDYVEQNQLYKSTLVRPTREKRKKHNDDDNEDKKIKKNDDSSRIKTARSANWGLARINQHEKGDLAHYEYDTMGG